MNDILSNSPSDAGTTLQMRLVYEFIPSAMPGEPVGGVESKEIQMRKLYGESNQGQAQPYGACS